MKKLFCLIAVIAVCFTSCGYVEATPSASVQQEQAQKRNLTSAVTAYPTPQVNNFVERKTITEWTKRWDKPSVVTYCYVFVGSNLIGYFVTNGKPASTQSYLIPETIWEDGHDLGEAFGEVLKESPDLDGTYGTNNPGYRFFLANGTAVECSGGLVSMIYADAPLSLKCQLINAVEVVK